MHSAYTSVICLDAVVAMETAEVVRDPYQAFQTQSIRNPNVFCKKSFITGLF